MMYHVVGVVRDMDYVKKACKPSADEPVRRCDLDVSPCPTVTAIGLRGASRHDYWLEFVPEEGE
jgi:hypothetical protein